MQTRSEQTRRRLILAGAEMFDRHGYANATIGQIAGAAGMTKGALYFHFASKDGLADAVQQRGRELLGDFVQRQWEQGAAPVQAVIDLTHWLAAKLRSDPLMRAGFRISKECTGRKPPVVGFHQVWITEVLRLLGQARAAGELREHTAQDGPETLLFATVCGIEVLAGTPLPSAELSYRIGALWEPLLSVLVPPHDLGRYRTHPPKAPAAAAGSAVEPVGSQVA
ncbi:ScbR family autoregulator-binding transcription factor [Streptomyces sp. NBC_01304]|uniref:ScbR family autoregulator-binding transcription factor n=1 Tax=Streptomyces sp. NBC_01304 TaxID=2903818 RepID=UPI002E144E94|nr:TetR/AcrR family transcriptional regulator [Streptomyces sp. NBC_01304]